MHAEQRARALIDAQLSEAGWQVQDRVAMDLFAGAGVAVREAIICPGAWPRHYLLYADRKVARVIEATPEGTALTRVATQSATSATGPTDELRLTAVMVTYRPPSLL